LYVQDQWAIKRATITGGVRLDYFNGQVPAQSSPAGTWVPAREFGAIQNVPNWRDLDPRFGISYDLFGNGKTAIKSYMGRYVQGLSASFSVDHRRFGNFSTPVNVLRSVSDYQPFTFMSPLDSSMITAYDVIPTKSSLVNNVVKFASDFGATETYTGFDVSVIG